MPAYYTDMARLRIQQNFIAMQHQRQNRKCEVSFIVLRDGTITDVRVVDSTGDPNLDRLALAAMERTRQLAKLPTYIKEDRIMLVVTFDFAMTH